MAGVSVATVSRVINGLPVVSEATCQRVQDAIERLRYVPNSAGRSLVTRRTGTIGLILADITNPFYTEVVRGVELAAGRRGLSVLLYDTAEDSARELKAIELLGSRQVDGVIVCASRLPDDRLALLTKAALPLVFVNRAPTSAAVGTVDVDQETGIRDAVTHLYGLGHRRIAYVGGPPASQVQARRLTAFRAMARQLGLKLPAGYTSNGSPTDGGGREAAHRLLPFPAARRPTAIIAYNDLVAIGIALVAGDLGLTIPDDLSLVGYDDIPFSAFLRPALTTVRQPARELGEQAVAMLVRHLDGSARRRRRLRFAPQLVIRASTTRLNGSATSQGADAGPQRSTPRPLEASSASSQK